MRRLLLRASSAAALFEFSDSLVNALCSAVHVGVVGVHAGVVGVHAGVLCEQLRRLCAQCVIVQGA